MSKEVVTVAFWGSIAIIIMVAITLLVTRSPTGEFTASWPYQQYGVQEACDAAGCVWDLELQREVYRSPYSEPSAGCYCDGQVRYIPLIQRVY